MAEPLGNLIVADTPVDAEEQLLYQANILHHISDAVIVTDPSFNVISWNHAAETLYGWRAAEVIGRPVNDIIQTQYTSEQREQVIHRFLEQGIWKGEAIQKHKNGATIYVQASVALIKDNAGQPVGAVAINRDITERKRAEEELQKREAQLNEAQRLANLGSWEWDVASDTVTWSDELYRIWDVNPQTFGATYEDVRQLFQPEDREVFDTLIQKAFEEHEPYVFEHRILRSDGSVRVMQSRGTVVVDEAGHVVRMLGTGQDVTERQQRRREMEAIAALALALRAAPNRAEMLAIIVHQVFKMLQADGVALASGEARTNETVIDYGYGLWAEWTGRRIPSGSGIGRHIVTTGQPYVSNDAGNDPRVARLDLGGDSRAFACIPLVVLDQTMGALLVSRRRAIAAEEVSLLLAISDIAANALQRAQVVETLEQRVAARTRELAQANERLKELDRLKSKFVSDVSHELRTPVTNLKLYADLLLRSPPEKHNHYIAVIREQAGRQAQLIEDILDISRLELAAGKIQFNSVALNALVAQVVAAHQPMAEAAGLALTFKPQPDLPPVRGELNQLAQVVTNLIANGLNYTPTGAVQVSTGLSEQVAFVEVHDTGMGIEPHDMPHLFERFYRGTQVRNVPGTGLGLAIVKEIVDLHEGKIDVHSQVGLGSTFRVYLPMAEPAAQGA